jgi:uncharacterized membrane protein YraQ (UPF0718 family)
MGYLDSLWHYLLVSAPYLIVGLFASGLIHAFISVDTIKKWLGQKRMRDIFTASAVGVPLPLCSCSVIPAAVTLKKSGASNASTSAFLISTPESGVDSIAMTYAMIDLPMTIIRPIAAFFSAITAGFAQYFFNPDEKDQEIEEEQKSCCSKTENKKKSFKGGMKYAFYDLINDLSVWLTIGILAGALIDYLVPANFFEGLAAWQGKALILAIGVPLYICASATTPIAASLIMKGMSPGAALLLLLVGPATNFSNMAVLQKYIGKKGIVLNIIAIVVVALIFAELTDLFYSTRELKLHMAHVHEHGGSEWWRVGSSIILVALLFRGIYIEELKPRITGKSSHVY